MTLMKNWYLLKSKPRQENVAVDNLQNQNYRTYCPKVIINNKTVILFPGYIFIQLDKKTQNWSPIKSTKGVSNFVKFGLNFARVPNNVIEFIKTNELSTKDKIINLNNFKPGENVRITDGMFKNCVAIFKSFKSDDRVILLINLLGQQQSINTDRKLIIQI